MIELLEYKDRLKRCSCLIVGDSMLDEYVTGNVKNISQEAPVPIVEVYNSNYTLGGAANVAKNIHQLGAKCTLIGIIGRDLNAQFFLEKLAEEDIEWLGISSENRVTTKKTRIIGNSHQIVRLDEETSCELPENDENILLETIKSKISAVDIIIISDYKKGVCTYRICESIIKIANAKNKYVIVDPKQSDWTRYNGAYLIKPNLKEFYKTVRKEDINIIQESNSLLDIYNITNILITRSQDGMLLINKDNVKTFRAEAKEVFDVSGAGDTVIATIAIFIAAGMNLLEAVKISNVAAGIAVSKLGTYAVSLDEIIMAMNHSYSKKVMLKNEVISFALKSKLCNKRVVFTNGCFDILHTGHISLFEQAKSKGDILIVGLNSDDSIRRLKGNNRPINNEFERAKLISALESVDAVVIFEEDTPIKLIEDILPDVLVKGADYTLDHVVGADIVIENGGEVVLVPSVPEKSTTGIIKKVQQAME